MDINGEKPLALTIGEGRARVNAVLAKREEAQQNAKRIGMDG
jgi:hypothetical protein